MRTLLFRGVAVMGAQAITVIVAAGLGGCAATAPAVTESLPHDTFRLKCQTPLPRCLERAEGICRGNRYTVLRAVDNHNYTGASGVAENEFRSSEALLRCGSRGKALWGAEADPMAQAAPPSAAPGQPIADVRAGACVPGVTQVCTGRAACRGGQSCLPNGSGFSPCDCGTETIEGQPRPSTDAPAIAPPPPVTKP